MVKSTSMRTTSRRSSASNSRIRLLASTTSVGSTKTVFPVDDSSCTIPLILRFKPGAIGTTNRPSRTVGVTSLSTSPSLCAALNILYKVRETLPSALCSCIRISARAGDAESFTLPYLSRIWSMRRKISGNVSTPSVSSWSVG